MVPGAFVIFKRTHGDRGAQRADVVLPGPTSTEKPGLYVNTEGRVQLAERANFPPVDAREDWAILRALSAVVGKTLPFDSLHALRQKLFADYPLFAKIDAIVPGDPADIANISDGGVTPGDAAFVSPIEDFFLTNPIARASAVMAECSALARGHLKQAAE